MSDLEVLESQVNKLKSENNRIIEILGTILESRNLEGEAHIQRVKEFTRILSIAVMKLYPEYGINPDLVETITVASSLHDIGKISIPDAILFKPGRLTKEEFDYMKTHTDNGCKLLEKITGAWDETYHKVIYDICRHHHEKFDGKGYPDGLRGDEIPISAQIVSVADVYDALVCERCYKDAFTHEQAFNMIVSGECGMFNPKLMDCFKKCVGQFEEVANANRERQIALGQ